MPFVTLATRSIFRLLFACVLFGFLQTPNAAVVTHSYQNILGNTWTVDLTVVNDGNPSEISGFTVFFDESVFANLSLAGSPAGWDSLVIDTDSGIPSAGFLDTFLLDPTQALTLGQSQGGFVVQFDFLGSNSLLSLPFDIVDENFATLASGSTRSANSVPEPNTGLLAFAALSIMFSSGWIRARKR